MIKYLMMVIQGELHNDTRQLCMVYVVGTDASCVKEYIVDAYSVIDGQPATHSHP